MAVVCRTAYDCISVLGTQGHQGSLIGRWRWLYNRVSMGEGVGKVVGGWGGGRHYLDWGVIQISYRRYGKVLSLHMY